MPTTTVAVITRTRNRPVFLSRALMSVASQTFRDYIHVVVNDGGEFAPVQAAVLALEDSAAARVVIVDNQDPQGREAAVNVGLRARHSIYFAIHDDDDWWEPTFLERTVSHLEAVPDDVAVCVRCDVVREHLDGEHLIEDSRELLASDLHAVSLVDTMVFNISPPIAQMVRREVAERVGYWDGQLPVQADWEFNLRILLEGPIGFIDGDALAHWSHRQLTGGDASNSVVSQRQGHHDVNLAIRDRYLRGHGRNEGADGFAAALAGAEYFRRIDERLSVAIGEVHRGFLQSDQYAKGYSDHMEAIHSDLVGAIIEQNDRLDQLSHKLDALLNAPSTWEKLRMRLRPRSR